jgi:hypothetical protein
MPSLLREHGSIASVGMNTTKLAHQQGARQSGWLIDGGEMGKSGSPPANSPTETAQEKSVDGLAVLSQQLREPKGKAHAFRRSYDLRNGRLSKVAQSRGYSEPNLDNRGGVCGPRRTANSSGRIAKRRMHIIHHPWLELGTKLRRSAPIWPAWFFSYSYLSSGRHSLTISRPRLHPSSREPSPTRLWATRTTHGC